jgi:hypothetical protein
MNDRLNFGLALFLCITAPATAGFMATPLLGGMSGPPGTYIPVVAKIQDRIEPKPVTVEKIIKPIVHEKTMLPWSCDTIRNATAGLTQAQLERLARVYKLTPTQRADAKKCISESRRWVTAR